MNEMNIEILIAYLKDELTAVDQATVETYLQEEPNGREQLAHAQQLLHGLQTNNLTPPSPSLLSRAQAAFRQQMKRVSDRVPHKADLQFDSWAQPMPLGVRGLPQERQLLFHEDAYDLDLQVVNDAARDAVTIRGQLLCATMDALELEGVALTLRHQSTGEERRGLTDGYGRFSFSHLDKGDYALVVALPSHDIVIHLDSLTQTE